MRTAAFSQSCNIGTSSAALGAGPDRHVEKRQSHRYNEYYRNQPNDQLPTSRCTVHSYIIRANCRSYGGRRLLALTFPDVMEPLLSDVLFDPSKDVLDRYYAIRLGYLAKSGRSAEDDLVRASYDKNSEISGQSLQQVSIADIEGNDRLQCCPHIVASLSGSSAT